MYSSLAGRFRSDKQGPNEHSWDRLEALGKLLVPSTSSLAQESEKQLGEAQKAAQLAEQQAYQFQHAQSPPSPSHPSTGAGPADMTYATAYSEDQPPAKKGPVRQSVAASKAPSAAAKKQALSKKKQREVS